MRTINGFSPSILLTVFLVFTIMGSETISAQDVKPANLEWTKLTSKAGDFSVAIPSDSWLTDKEDDVARIFRSVKDSSITITFEPLSGARQKFEQQLKLPQRDDDQTKIERYKMGDFLVEQSYGRKSRKLKYPYTHLIMASSKGRYTITVLSRSESSELYKLILGSIEFGGIPLYDELPRPTITETMSSKLISADQQVLSAIKVPDATHNQLIRSREKFSLEEWVSREEEQPENLTRGLIILRKVKASYTDKARRKWVKGTVTLSVNFRADGSVGDIVLLDSLDKGLDQNAFEVAKKLKFLPQMIDGKAVDAVRRVSYTFDIY